MSTRYQSDVQDMFLYLHYKRYDKFKYIMNISTNVVNMDTHHLI